MNKNLIIIVLVLSSLTYSAAPKDSKVSLIAINTAVASSPTAMATIEGWKGLSASSYNSAIALRGMVHNHPDLKLFAKQFMFLGVNNACQVAIVMACRAQDRLQLATVVTSLEETPLTTPPGCDGTTCRKLLDNTKTYYEVHCSGCNSYHALNEPCCACYLCPHYGQPATLYADTLVERELKLRELEKVNAAYRQQQKEEFEKRVKRMKERNKVIAALHQSKDEFATAATSSAMTVTTSTSNE